MSNVVSIVGQRLPSATPRRQPCLIVMKRNSVHAMYNLSHRLSHHFRKPRELNEISSEFSQDGPVVITRRLLAFTNELLYICQKLILIWNMNNSTCIHMNIYIWLILILILRLLLRLLWLYILIFILIWILIELLELNGSVLNPHMSEIVEINPMILRHFHCVTAINFCISLYKKTKL